MQTSLNNKARASVPATDRTLPPEIESSGWKFSDTHRRLYAAIQADVSAKTAFQRLTTGARAVSPAILLLTLEAESFANGKPRKYWEEWERWKYKWEDLGRTARSLKRIAASIEKQIERSDCGWGPIPLPALLPMTEGVAEEKDRKEWRESLQAGQRLGAIATGLRENALEIEHLCQMRREWMARMPRKHRNTMQNEWHVLFLRFVEARTGEPHFEDLAALLNTCHVVSQPESKDLKFSADYLRKLSSRFSTPLIEKHYPTR